MNEIPASEAPTTTILELFTILGSEILRLVTKDRAKELSF